jgi:flagellar biosynthesis anti-sigma factor FlgM
MKIENSSMLPLSAKPAETPVPVEKKDELAEANSVRSGHDSVEMSENARLLAKARTALGNVEEPNSDRLKLIKTQIESGDYTVQVRDLARKLIANLYPK